MCIYDETLILLIGVPCEVCEHRGALAFEAERGRVELLFIPFIFRP
jgi:hypothetical protein